MVLEKFIMHVFVKSYISLYLQIFQFFIVIFLVGNVFT